MGSPSSPARRPAVDGRRGRDGVPQVEDLLFYKAVAWRDRDKEDVERLLLLHGDAIDLRRVRDLVCRFAEALEEPERVEQFESLVRKTLD